MFFWIKISHKQMNNNNETLKKPSGIKDFISFIVLTTIIVLPIRLFIAQPFIVNGSSMSPTFETSQYLIVDQLSYRFHEPARGDVIIFRYPNNTKIFYIKRIIGLPGETVNINENTVTIKNSENPNGIVLDEPFVVFPKETFMEKTLSDSEYFVMGDNRAASSDSRVWGALPKDLIIGKAFVRLWPFSKINYLPGEFSL
jgi:signal peptidase I